MSMTACQLTALCVSEDSADTVDMCTWVAEGLQGSRGKGRRGGMAAHGGHRAQHGGQCARLRRGLLRAQRAWAPT